MPDDDVATNPHQLTEEVSELETLVNKWFARMRRSHALYIDTFKDEEFEDLVAAIVTAAFIERVLLIGIQLAGFSMKPGRKISFTLERLIRIASSQGWMDRSLRKLCEKLADIRNEAAHNIDFRLTPEIVEELRDLLPPKNKETIQRALNNIFGDIPVGTTAVLVYEQIAHLAFAASQKAGVLPEEPVPAVTL